MGGRHNVHMFDILLCKISPTISSPLLSPSTLHSSSLHSSSLLALPSSRGSLFTLLGIVVLQWSITCTFVGCHIFFITVGKDMKPLHLRENISSYLSLFKMYIKLHIFSLWHWRVLNFGQDKNRLICMLVSSALKRAVRRAGGSGHGALMSIMVCCSSRQLCRAWVCGKKSIARSGEHDG